MKKWIRNTILILAVLTNLWLPGFRVLATMMYDVEFFTMSSADDLPTQITDLLTAHPLLQTREAQVLDVSSDGEAILTNLSRAILPDGTYNTDTFAQLTRALDVEDGQQRIGEGNEWVGQC